MKKILFTMLLCPILLISSRGLGMEARSNSHEISDKQSAEESLQKLQEKKENRQKQRDIEDARQKRMLERRKIEDARQKRMLERRKIEDANEERKLKKALTRAGREPQEEKSLQPKPVQSEAGEKLDFAMYAREDALRALDRTTSDSAREKEWAAEDKIEVEKRNKENALERAFKALSSDAQVDTGIEGKRNQRLLELNRERILEDFKLRAERLDILKRKHPKFADKPGWKSLLELGDMNKFIELSYKDRKDLITSIQKAVAQLTSETNNIEPEDMAALHDLIQLTIPKSALPIEFKQNLSDTLPTEFAQLTAEQQEQTKQNLRSLLKESLPNSIKMLTEFNEETKSLQKDLKSLENIKRIKNIGIAVFWVLGTVAAICMLAHVAIIIGPIVLGMEVFAIAAKVGFYFYHTKHHEEAEASNALQTKFLNTFKPLLPETTKVLETISYKNKASGFGERIDQGITGKLSKLENTEWSRRYLSAKEGVSAAATTAKEKLTAAKTAIVSHPRYLSAKESINKAQTNIKTSLAQSKPGKWIASHQTEDPEDELDASEFSLITPKPKSI